MKGGKNGIISCRRHDAWGIQESKAHGFFLQGILVREVSLYLQIKFDKISSLSYEFRKTQVTGYGVLWQVLKANTLNMKPRSTK